MLVLLLLLLPCSASAEGLALPYEQLFPAHGPHAAALARDGLATPLADAVAAWKKRTGKAKCPPRLVVVKAARRLDAYCGDEVVKSYVVNLGLEPVADKIRQGDRATPEGELYVCSFNEKSQFYRFLGLSYPDAADAKRGLAAGLVNKEQAAEIERAEQRRSCPPWGTNLGGAVGIHGGGSYEVADGKVTVWDWTFGCVALRDQDVKELFYGFAKVGTPVRILAADAPVQDVPVRDAAR